MDYSVRLEQFEGPLDLLLHLIERAEVDIQDIFVSEITSQYLEYMRQIDTLDMDTASEFLTIAARLVYIKSRALLPRPAAAQDEDEETEADFILRLREYKLYKQIGAALTELREVNRGALARLPEEFAFPAPEVTWTGGTVSALYDAMQALLSRSADNVRSHPLHRVSADKYTVRGQAAAIRLKLAGRSILPFEELFDGQTERMEIIVTFMAMLEMASRGEIYISQSTPYGALSIRPRDLMSETDVEASRYSDEYGE
ncbi:MAG: segregation/condensation protein A [Clostridia bacterium]|nr:segregation/condensation protein A [Clostridia bacterium]